MGARLGLLAAAALFGAAGGPALACQGQKTLFSDQFKQVDASWGLDQPDVAVEEGKVKVKAQPDVSNLLIYKGIVFTDADFCITVRMPSTVANSDSTMAGPIFWAQDYDNYYMFMVTPSGYAEITRKLKGKWLDVIPWRQSNDIRREPGKNNVLEIQTHGDTITTLINGARFEEVRGQVPDGGGQVGMRAQSEKDQVDTWKFSDLRVTDLPAASPAPAAASTAAPVTPDARPAAPGGGSTPSQ